MNNSLNELYQIEFEQHSKVLESGFLTLREKGASSELLNEFLRAAHSLKGAARLVGKGEIASSAHSLEALVKEIGEGALEEGTLNKIHTLLQQLGLRADSLRGDTNTSMVEGSGQSMLHVSPDQISALIHLSSDVAVIARRLFAALENRTESSSSKDLFSESEIERLFSLSHAMQEATYELRLVRLGEITKSLDRIVSATAEATHKRVEMQVINGSALVDRQLIAILEPCLIQIVKNSVDHGIESEAIRTERGKKPSGRITIAGRQLGAHLQIVVSDDGGGLDFEKIRSIVVQRGHHSIVEAAKLTPQELIEFLFLPGFSTKDEVSEFSGRGIGLDIVRSRLEEIGGSISMESTAGRSTTFTLSIPSQIASFRSLLFVVGRATVAVPLAYIERVLPVEQVHLVQLEGYMHAMVEGVEIPIVSGDGWGVGSGAQRSEIKTLLILNAAGKRKALSVDRILGEEETVLKRLDKRFEKQSKLLGTTVGRDNTLISILNVEALLSDQTARTRTTSQSTEQTTERSANQHILVVDDSLTVRELERRILLSAGYACETAVDGIDALQKLQEQKFDLIVTDIDMPRLNGYEFIKEVRGGAVTGVENLPIVVVSYKERAAERTQALSLGASDFLSKGSFKDQSFITAVNKLLNNLSREAS